MNDSVTTTPLPPPPPLETPTTSETTPPATEPAAPTVEALTRESLTFPEGMTVNDAHLTSFLNIVNDGALSPKDRANALINLQGEVTKSVSEGFQKEWDKVRAGWIEMAKADKEFGGTNLEPTLGSISKLMEQFGDPGLREVFDATGTGDNPLMIRFLGKIAKTLTEPAMQTFTPQPASVEKTRAQILYGDK